MISMANVQIRFEESNDIKAIRHVTTVAFATVEHSNQTEAAIVEALRKAGSLSVSLVAIQGNELVGHVAFSPVTISGENQGWFGLGPVSVHPKYQNKGIGEKLIRQGLNCLAGQNAGGCVVLGAPQYYKRFGFENDSDLYYEGAPAKYFMRLAFKSPVARGKVAYHESFNAQ
jgi:putative acetyltransferase